MLAAGLIAHKFAALDPRLAQAGQKYAQLKNGLSAKTTQTLHGLALKMAQLERINPSTSSLQLQTRASSIVTAAAQAGAFGPMPPGGDISELCFVVLMEATNDQDQDLQEIMNEVQAQTAAKQFLRQQMQIVNTDVANLAKQNSRSSQQGQSLVRDAVVNYAATLGRRK